MFLISTYPSVKEIENMRDTRLDQINAQISASEAIHRQPHDTRRRTHAALDDLRALQHQARRAPHARRSRRGNGARIERVADTELGAGAAPHGTAKRSSTSSTATSSASRNCALRRPCASTSATPQEVARAAARVAEAAGTARQAAKSSTTSSRTCTTGTITICAMRSPGCIVNSVRAAVPAGHHQLTLVVGIDQPDQVAEHHAVFVAQSRARQDHGGQARIIQVDGEPGGNKLGPAGRQRQRRIQAGAQVQARGTGGGVSRQRELPPMRASRMRILRERSALHGSNHGVHAVILASRMDFARRNARR